MQGVETSLAKAGESEPYGADADAILVRGLLLRKLLDENIVNNLVSPKSRWIPKKEACKFCVGQQRKYWHVLLLASDGRRRVDGHHRVRSIARGAGAKQRGTRGNFGAIGG
jgi:hypothetical protein